MSKLSGGFYRKGFLGICFIPQNHTGICESFGKFTSVRQTGLNFYIPFRDKIFVVSNMTYQQTYDFEVKTLDNIFAVLSVAVQVRVRPEDAFNAAYSMDDPTAMIHSAIDSEIRAQVSRRNLDRLYEEQAEISHSLFEARKDVTGNVVPSTAEQLKSQGFTVKQVLIRHINPAAKVKDAMNDINASLRMREAAKFEADARYITSVREAEADRDRKRLQGEGISLERLAILRGYEEGVINFSSHLGMTPKEVTEFVLRTQYMDTLQTIAKSSQCKTLFLDHAALPNNTNGMLTALEGASGIQYAEPTKPK